MRDAFDRFAIVQAYYLYSAMFGWTPARSMRAKTRGFGTSRALRAFSPSLTIREACAAKCFHYVYGPFVFGTALPKNDDYQATRDAYARLLRRARTMLREGK